MDYFVWILEASRLQYLASGGGVSSSYIVPNALMLGAPQKLAGSRLTLALKGPKGDVALSTLFVQKVEQFEDGVNAGDFLLTVDPAKSFRFIKAYDNTSAVNISSFTSGLKLGLQPFSEKSYLAILDSVQRGVAVKLQAPPSVMLLQVSETAPSKLNDLSVGSLLGAVTSKFSLEEVWASGSKPKLPPFANFAFHKLKEISSQEAAEQAINLLSALDPTVGALPAVPQQCEKSGLRLKPEVDVKLQPIDINALYARKFVAGVKKHIDLAETLEKTENAEKRHQDMLRDIASQLQKLNLVPKQSSSIDLFVEKASGCVTFELKTAHESNILGQSAKGLFQLGCYKIALNDLGYSDNMLVLVLERIGEETLEAYTSQVLNFFGIKPLFYDLSKPWPERLPGLHDLLV